VQKSRTSLAASLGIFIALTGSAFAQTDVDPGRRLTVPPVAGSLPESGASLLPQAKAEKPDKKAKGPTEIVALDATFDQKAHVAVFLGQVVVTDPEFTVQCDKLTAYLKHDDKPAAEAPSTRLRATPAPEPTGDAKKSKGGGLERAIAEASPGGIVTVTQEKQEADGTTSRSIGHGKKATYDATTGDIFLYGKPDVQQGINTCVATDEATVMVLNRDGKMRVTGAHKTVIKDQGDMTK
jgi:lipopolysaccharide export system protein LptA